jgi:excisionase family DNA binding protein
MAEQTHTPMLSLIEVAERLSVHPRTVARLVGRHDLDAYRVGGQLRVDESDLAVYLERQRIGVPE